MSGNPAFTEFLFGPEGKEAQRLLETSHFTEALEAAFAAGQRSAEKEAMALQKEVRELRDLCANNGIKV